jgi:hypothetical protein
VGLEHVVHPGHVQGFAFTHHGRHLVVQGKGGQGRALGRVGVAQHPGNEQGCVSRQVEADPGAIHEISVGLGKNDASARGDDLARKLGRLGQGLLFETAEPFPALGGNNGVYVLAGLGNDQGVSVDKWAPQGFGQPLAHGGLAAGPHAKQVDVLLLQ